MVASVELDTDSESRNLYPARLGVSVFDRFEISYGDLIALGRDCPGLLASQLQLDPRRFLVYHSTLLCDRVSCGLMGRGGMGERRTTQPWPLSSYKPRGYLNNSTPLASTPPCRISNATNESQAIVRSIIIARHGLLYYSFILFFFPSFPRHGAIQRGCDGSNMKRQ
jgi:hypothetical protein